MLSQVISAELLSELCTRDKLHVIMHEIEHIKFAIANNLNPT